VSRVPGRRNQIKGFALHYVLLFLTRVACYGFPSRAQRLRATFNELWSKSYFCQN